MSELKLPRLLAAAKEFNIGQDTLIDFLAKKGFNKDELKPTAKLSEAMYFSLQSEFQNDKQAKNKADLVEIPKSQQTERKKRDEEEITFKRDDKKSSTTFTPKVEPTVEAAPTIIPAFTAPSSVIHTSLSPTIISPTIVSPTIIEPVVVTPAVVIEEKIEKDPTQEPVPIAVLPITPFLEIEKKHQEPVVLEEQTKEEVITKIDAPEIEGPKVISKIDLSAIDSSTRPRKVADKKDNETVEDLQINTEPIFVEVKQIEPNPTIEKTEIVEVSQPSVKEESIVNGIKIEEKEIESISILESIQVENIQPVEDDAPVIENIQAEKLTGPKILGKIELPVDNDTRPKLNNSIEDRKKRKRILVEPNRRVGGAHVQQNLPTNQSGQPNNFQNRTTNNTGNPPISRENRGNYTPQPAPNTGSSRPIVPAQNRGGGQNQAGGGFNRNNYNNNTQGQGRQQSGGASRPVTSSGRNTGRRDDKEIDAKEIQDKIKETQAKLSGGGGRGKSLKAKYRRAKRDEAAESMNDGENEDNKLQVTEFVTVSELANLMDVSFADVIGKCMGLGIMVSINQRLDAEVIELVASEFNFEVEFLGIDDINEMDDDSDEEELVDSETRPPIVTIMGHVDHGKTSLLDYIRNANVVAGEAGGITQHIGAYEVTLPDGKAITFLDTPGHEAFTAMRARGAKVTDIAVIVVAADDAVMPQTKEAISHAQAAGVPMIFAVNKIDKDGANPQKIYEQLANMNILVESWGGKFQSQELSAKKGLNVDLLLEKILLEAELLDVKANASKVAVGSIIEASLDKGRGYVATILVQNGTLHQGDLLVSGQYFGRVKAMFNERNQRVTVAPPSTPVVLLGLNGAPQAGEKFKVYHDESEAKEVANKRAQISREQGLRARKHITLDEIGRRLALGNFKELNIIIKGDVDGSVEALSDSLQKLSNPEIAIRVVHKAVGQISESDILLAAASDAIIVGFNVRPSSQASKLAENEGVQVKMYSIIYTAIDEIRSAMEGMLEPKVEEKEVATVEIREVYKFDKATVAGCYVQEGKIKRDHKIRVFRDGILVYPRHEGGYAELGSLKRFKDDVKEVNNGYECGLTVKGFADLNVNDSIIAYEEEEVKRTL